MERLAGQMMPNALVAPVRAALFAVTPILPFHGVGRTNVLNAVKGLEGFLAVAVAGLLIADRLLGELGLVVLAPLEVLLIQAGQVAPADFEDCAIDSFEF